MDVEYKCDINIIVNSLVYFWEDVMFNHKCLGHHYQLNTSMGPVKGHMGTLWSSTKT